MNKIQSINQQIEEERMKFDTSMRRLHELKMQAYDVCEEEYGHDFSDDELNCSLCGVVNESLFDRIYDEDYRTDLAISEHMENQ